LAVTGSRKELDALQAVAADLTEAGGIEQFSTTEGAGLQLVVTLATEEPTA
jgi:hypothetical protein